MAEKSATLWVLSNRTDDRVVLWERSSEHPNGEALVGGSAPAFVGRTGQVEQLLREGLLIEVPEPKDGPKKPVRFNATAIGDRPDMPGQTIKLGRTLDSDLFPESAIKAAEAKQEQLPDEVPVPAGVVVPPEPASQRSTSRR